jgi:chromobox protein 1
VKKEKEAEWSPPPGSWENDVDYVDTVEESADPKTGDLTRYAYLVWLNTKKTQHPLVHVYQKCPQKVRPQNRAYYLHSGTNVLADAQVLREPSRLHSQRR